MAKCILPSVSPITAKYLRYVDRAITTVVIALFTYLKYFASPYKLNYPCTCKMYTKHRHTDKQVS